ncbi:squalene/phytoene synthase family protein [Streptomyces sp. NPDC096205]|uniref:squalene/phytoene synthase family protein n=1 Tax=Streptomyces sp. NPDC096205 TaxID=3366081 RepID=UPI00381A67DE
MSVWKRGLDAAGIHEPGLRRDYSAQRKVVRRFRRSSYLAARVLLPPAVLPHAMAATAFMHHGDNLLDTGTTSQRATAWAAWERQVRTALETGRADDPLIHTLLHTIGSYPRLRPVVAEYLSTAAAELEFEGFATEDDYQAYVDAYSHPAFMLVATLLGPQDDDGRFRAACRTLIDGSQRLDFVNDLAEDLREGRLGIPEETLKRFSVTVEDLKEGRRPTGLGDLVAHELGLARAALLAAGQQSGLAAPEGRPLMRALVDIELRTADAALGRGAGLLRGPASPPPVGTVRTLLRERRAARG